MKPEKQNTNSAQLELMFGLVELEYILFFVGGGVTLHILSSLIMVRLFTENQLSSLPVSASKVCVVGGWWWLRANLVIDFGLALA